MPTSPSLPTPGDFVRILLNMSGGNVAAEAHATLDLTLSHPMLPLFGVQEGELRYRAEFRGPYDADKDGFPEFKVWLWAGPGAHKPTNKTDVVALLDGTPIEIDPKLLAAAVAGGAGEAKKATEMLFELVAERISR